MTYDQHNDAGGERTNDGTDEATSNCTEQEELSAPNIGQLGPNRAADCAAPAIKDPPIQA